MGDWQKGGEGFLWGAERRFQLIRRRRGQTLLTAEPKGVGEHRHSILDSRALLGTTSRSQPDRDCA